MAERRQALDESATMPLAEHLRDLRLRLRNSIIALLGGFAVAYGFKHELALLMLRPYQRVWTQMQGKSEAFGEPSMYFTSMVEPFWAFFTLSLWAGVFIACPLIFHQIWKFIAPGLYEHERHYGLGFVLASVVCFLGGAVFCYLLVLEPVYEFLLGFATSNLQDMAELGGAAAEATPLGLKPILTIQEYMGLARRMILAFGLIFELPLLIFFLSLVGVVTHRELWRFNRWWIVLSFVVGAILTPPDIFSQILMAGPLVVLYNISIVIAWLVTRRRERRLAAMERGEYDDGQEIEE